MSEDGNGSKAPRDYLQNLYDGLNPPHVTWRQAVYALLANLLARVERIEKRLDTLEALVERLRAERVELQKENGSLRHDLEQALARRPRQPLSVGDIVEIDDNQPTLRSCPPGRYTVVAVDRDDNYVQVKGEPRPLAGHGFTPVAPLWWVGVERIVGVQRP